MADDAQTTQTCTTATSVEGVASALNRLRAASPRTSIKASTAPAGGIVISGSGNRDADPFVASGRWHALRVTPDAPAHALVPSR